MEKEVPIFYMGIFKDKAKILIHVSNCNFLKKKRSLLYSRLLTQAAILNYLPRKLKPLILMGQQPCKVEECCYTQSHIVDEEFKAEKWSVV